MKAMNNAEMVMKKNEQFHILELHVSGEGLVNGWHEGGRVMIKNVETKDGMELVNYHFEACGVGTFISTNVEYNGKFLNNLFHDLSGTACLAIYLKSKYTGVFHLGHRSGHGVLEKYNPDTGEYYIAYKGTWLNDREETGIYYSPNGEEDGTISKGHHHEYHTLKTAVPIAPVWSSAQLYFDPNKNYIICLSERAKALEYDQDQSGWELCARRTSSSDKRNDSSTYVSLINAPQNNGYHTYWNIISDDNGKTFVFRLADRSREQNFDQGQAGWELCAYRYYDKDKKGDNSTYAIVHNPNYDQCKYWHISSDDVGKTFLIRLSGRSRSDWHDVDQTGWELAAHRFYKDDKRDAQSTFVRLCAPIQNIYSKYWNIRLA